MTFEERAERLLKHPDTATVEIAGEDRPWFLGKVTFDLAAAKGIELGKVLSQFEAIGDDAGLDAVSGLIGSFGDLLYFGMLPFDEDLEPADVTDLLSIGDLHRLMPVLMASLQDHAEAEQGKAEATAKRQAQSVADKRKR